MEAVLKSMIDHIPDLLDLNVTVSFVILFVICVRKLLGRAPRIFSYALWGIVLLRLLIPISIESPMSFLPERRETSAMVELNEVLPEIQLETPQDRSENEFRLENTPPGEPIIQVSRSLNAETYLCFIWIAGMTVMLIRSGISYGKLRRKVTVSVPLQKEIYIADDIDTPFVMGIFCPKIYLPGTLEPSERKYIIAHERHHIRRGDHIFKALGYLALTIHWFNPFVWVAFVLSSRDMEMSCDEAVIRNLGEDVRAEYASSLLNLATGQRLFTGTPLAFGEGDPTERVRNLAKWKKPAIWVSVICVVVCLIMAVCLLTDPESRTAAVPQIPETTSTLPEETQPVPETDWGVALLPDRVSRTGATALFVYSGSVPGEEGAELTYGDYLSLERLVNGNWIPCDELPGFHYYVGDSSYPVVDGYGMVHEWENRFGSLADGHYRLGKMVTLERPDGSKEVRMIYGQFSLPYSIPDGPTPLESLPELYGAEQAAIDGCLVLRDGDAMENIDSFKDFVKRCTMGESGFFRIVNWYYGDNPHYFAFDLNYDGNTYMISWLQDGRRKTQTFDYLKHFTGEKESAEMAYDAYEHYVLLNDFGLTWTDIRSGNEEYMIVFSDYSYYPDLVEIPKAPVKAELVFQDLVCVTVTDPSRLQGIQSLFASAEYLGYEPKTHSIGVGLNLVLTSADGATMTIELDPDNDLCRINGEYVFYGAPEEPCYIPLLWEYLGIGSWPEFLYESCENAYTP